MFSISKENVITLSILSIIIAINFIGKGYFRQHPTIKTLSEFCMNPKTRPYAEKPKPKSKLFKAVKL